MPTAGKLLGAIFFAALAYLTAELFKPSVPEGTSFGNFSLYVAAIGLGSGWFVMGPRAPEGGMAQAISAGLQAALTTAFFALLGFGIYLMLGKALRKMYKGPFEAITGVFELMVENLFLVLTSPQVMAALLVGGPLCGIAVHKLVRRH